MKKLIREIAIVYNIISFSKFIFYMLAIVTNIASILRKRTLEPADKMMGRFSKINFRLTGTKNCLLPGGTACRFVVC